MSQFISFVYVRVDLKYMIVFRVERIYDKFKIDFFFKGVNVTSFKLETARNGNKF